MLQIKKMNCKPTKKKNKCTCTCGMCVCGAWRVVHGMCRVLLCWYITCKEFSERYKSILRMCVWALSLYVYVIRHLEPYDAGRGKGTANEIKKDVAYINAQYRDHPACLKDDNGLAVFFVYDSYRTPASEWAKLFKEKGGNSVRGNSADGVFISLVVEKNHLKECVAGGFDGFYTYFAVDKFSWGSTWKNFGSQQKFADQNRLQFYPSVGPGYDDTRVRPWNSANTRSREGGRYYARAFQALLSAKSSRVTLTSWNEWHEGTQIEEATAKKGYPDYSPGGEDFYLKETRKHLLAWAESQP